MLVIEWHCAGHVVEQRQCAGHRAAPCWSGRRAALRWSSSGTALVVKRHCGWSSNGWPGWIERHVCFWQELVRAGQDAMLLIHEATFDATRLEDAKAKRHRSPPSPAHLDEVAQNRMSKGDVWDSGQHNVRSHRRRTADESITHNPHTPQPEVRHLAL